MIQPARVACAMHRPALPQAPCVRPGKSPPSLRRTPFLGDCSRLPVQGLKVPNAAAALPGRRGLQCQALNVDPVLQALPAIGGATAGAVVGVPAAVIAALVVTGLSKMVEGTLNKDDKVSLAGLTATVGVEALVLMAHMTVGAVVSCAITGRPTF